MNNAVQYYKSLKYSLEEAGLADASEYSACVISSDNKL